MADISYSVEHSLSHEAAKQAAQKVADNLSQEYGLQCQWNGDVLNFQRSGVKGELVVEESSAHIEIKLGMLLSAFSGKIEDQVTRNMRKVFTGKE